MSPVPGADTRDRFAAARAVADAVLFEGYMLYPYRASSRKNQVRWQFGVLVPRAFSEADGFERWFVRTESLISVVSDPVVTVRIRFLQVERRVVESVSDGAFVAGGPLAVDGVLHVDWVGAVERCVDLPSWDLADLDGDGRIEEFVFGEAVEAEEIRDRSGRLRGRILHRREPVEGRVRVGAVAATAGLARLTVVVENAGSWIRSSASRQHGRDAVLGRSLIAVHTMLAVDGGRFVSVIDPPEDVTEVVTACSSEGTFPVLIGADDVVLSSPIILYDHPEVAPESGGDLYDATEIDEILALRVLTLTDEEKSEARGTDPRAAAIVDRCDSMTAEAWDRMHGTVRPLRPAPAEPPSAPWWDPGTDAEVDPWSDRISIAGVAVAKGTTVRLHPSHRADAQDLFLDGLTAVVAGVFADVDGTFHVAVTLDDDPASAELAWQGRYLFFHPDEVEPTGSRPLATGGEKAVGE